MAVAAVSAGFGGVNVIKGLTESIAKLVSYVSNEMGYHKNTQVMLEHINDKTEILKTRLERLVEHCNHMPMVQVDNFEGTKRHIEKCFQSTKTVSHKYKDHEVKQDYIDKVQEILKEAERDLDELEEKIKESSLPKVKLGGPSTLPNKVTKLEVKDHLEALIITWKDTENDKIKQYEIEIHYLSIFERVFVEAAKYRVDQGNRSLLSSLLLTTATNEEKKFEKGEYMVRLYDLDAWINYMVRVRAISEDETRGEWCDFETHFLCGRPMKPEVPSVVESPEKGKIKLQLKHPQYCSQMDITHCRLEGYSIHNKKQYLKTEKLEFPDEELVRDCTFPDLTGREYRLRVCYKNKVDWSQPSDYFILNFSKLPLEGFNLRHKVNESQLTFSWKNPMRNGWVIKTYVVKVFKGDKVEDEKKIAEHSKPASAGCLEYKLTFSLSSPTPVLTYCTYKAALYIEKDLQFETGLYEPAPGPDTTCDVEKIKFSSIST